MLSKNIHENTEIEQQVRTIFSESVFTEIVNGFLIDVAKGNPVTSISTDSFNSDTNLLEWRIARSEWAACTLKIIDGKPHKDRKSFYLYPNDIFLYFHGKGHCKAILYEFEDTDDFDHFNKDRLLISKTSLSLQGGEGLLLKAGIHGLLMLDVKDIVLFEVSSFKHHNIVWNFSTETDKMIFPSSADVSSTRLTVAMDVLTVLGNKESEAVIEDIVKSHHQHFVRWKGIETLSVLNQDKTFKLLNRALKDEHHEVRKAARESLELNGVNING